MNGRILIAGCLLMIAGKAMPATDGLQSLIERLDAIDRYDASASYSVLLPSAADDIIYRIDLQSIKSSTDTLSPASYLIEWSLPTPSGTSVGFSAYDNGNHFRYRDQRLQEYHFQWDSVPFMSGRGGVQRNAQFTELLPQFIASQLREIASGSHYSYRFVPDSIISGRHCSVIEATETHRGYTAREMLYLFDRQTAMPIKITSENNPGSISEQTVSISYHPSQTNQEESFAEENLIRRHPEVFERFRQSNFRVENLPGTKLPAFSLPTTTAERYTRHRDDPFASPVIIALIDPGVSTSSSTIDAVREAAGTLPFNIGIIWAFLSNDTDHIETLLKTTGPEETILMSARSLARDCGVTSFPTLIFTDRTGTVRDIQLGFSQNLKETVRLKAATSAGR